MPYQLLYLHGDPESTSIHLQLDKTIKFQGILIPKIHDKPEFAVGYAFCLYDHPEVFINPAKKEGNYNGAGYFGILDVKKNKVIGIVLEKEDNAKSSS